MSADSAVGKPGRQGRIRSLPLKRHQPPERQYRIHSLHNRREICLYLFQSVLRDSLETKGLSDAIFFPCASAQTQSHLWEVALHRYLLANQLAVYPDHEFSWELAYFKPADLCPGLNTNFVNVMRTQYSCCLHIPCPCGHCALGDPA